MQYNEACNILGVQPGAAQEEINSKFRKLAAKMHPDVNKEPGAEDKYKQLSAAYEFLKSYKEHSGFNGRSSVNDFFNDFISNVAANNYKYEEIARKSDIKLSVTITFVESVLGCAKKIPIEKNVRCGLCNGLGIKYSSDKCDKCNGAGRIVNQRAIGPNQIIRQVITCPDCKGHGKKAMPCENCNGIGSKLINGELTVQIPGGIVNNSVFTINNGGHYHLIDNVQIQGQAFVTVNVESDPDMTLNGNDVFSKVNISLCEALTGIDKNVQTVYGQDILKIPGQIKHNDIVELCDKGVPKKGHHKFIIQVDYPSNIDDLIKFLTKDKEVKDEA